MTYKETAAKPKPATDQIEKKIHAWEAAKMNATNTHIRCPDWLRKVCYELPRIADPLLAWLIESTAYISDGGYVVLNHRSENWGSMVNQYLYQHIKRDELFAAILKALAPTGTQKLL